MPSRHVGWAIWAAAAVGSVLRRRALRRLALLYPVAMVWSVMVTGNHWLLDTVGGAAVVRVAYLVLRGSKDRKHW